MVDPLHADIQKYIDFAASKDMSITHVIDTHVHADHRSGGFELAGRTGGKYCLHESAKLSIPFTPLQDGDLIALGNVKINVLHTPGHTPESICMLVVDARRSPDPWFMLSGDTLFSGAVGRPDLPGEARQYAANLYDSLHSKIIPLRDDLEVYPGHFAGAACGEGLSGKPSTTVGFEKRANALLSLSKDAFIDRLTEIELAKPPGMDENIRINSEGI
jgi:glyoxylase-like metal-dependent hydrolase (beta-lactamase superfamily II)